MPSRNRCPWNSNAAVATSRTKYTAAVSQPRSAANPGARDRELAGEEPERWKAQERDERERGATSEHRSPREETAQLGDPGRAVDEGRFTGRQERHGLAERMREHVQEQRADGQTGADRGRECDEAHVLDARVGEEPFGIALADHE